MKRLINYHLLEWKNDPYRMPLLLHGARQTGKTYAARGLGKHFEDFIEINFEETPTAYEIFERDLTPALLLQNIALRMRREIIPGKTLLFFDEIQLAPKALIALRYFYEKMPQLHVIAAGSLLDFAIEEVGIPVGRVQSLYMFPLSFMEFLASLGEKLIIEEILNHELDTEMSPSIHKKILALVAEYLALGGMPKVVACWQNIKNALKCASFHESILANYRHDFSKYAKKKQIKYVELVFNSIQHQLGEKFKFSAVEGEFRKRELSPALDLLETAGIAHKVHYSACQGFPLGAQVNPLDYKVFFLDVGLSQATLNLDIAHWFLYPETELINKGSLMGAFVGQELLAYSNPHNKHALYYWHREAPSSQAEIDYVIQKDQHVIPIEVKGGHGKTLKSMRSFLDTHKLAPYGIRFSTHNYSIFENIHSYPLYAIAKVAAGNPDVKRALGTLID